MLVPSFEPNMSLSDNDIAKTRYLPWIHYQQQNAVAYGCRVAPRILRQPPFLKSQSSKIFLIYFHVKTKF